MEPVSHILLNLVVVLLSTANLITGDDAYDLLVANGEYIYTVHFEGNDNDVIRNEAGEKNIGVDVHFGLETVPLSQLCFNAVFLDAETLKYSGQM